ncbi:TUBBY-LIKE F-BOX PROTEIN [Salix koriyanagi]|uniref:Tubby-like F-box protein n=1 Tax=Salix koriyanagi TaxID=2511006 RepID=A0A9Q0SLF0_9ROSI|nr:TUBBY-LIKE F-BOX PROTEIN [Salix koriyanagi]
MSFKSKLKEIRDDITTTFSMGKLQRNRTNRRGRAYIAPELGGGSELLSELIEEQSPWANLPPELLHDVIKRVEGSETSWPGRRDVVACASVCKSWREITKAVVKTPEQCGRITFPISLKQPGPRDAPIQCFIKRERATSTYHLYLGLSPALSASNTYAGKLRSNFLGTKFTINDCQPPCPRMKSNCKLQRKVRSIQVSPGVPARNHSVATVSYELNVLRTRGPRRMHCTIHSIPISAIQEGGIAFTPLEFNNPADEQSPSLYASKVKHPLIDFISTSHAESSDSICSKMDPLVLKNKAPRWHEQLQCWCLNFKGRVTVASVKNFQLVAAVEPCQNVPVEEQEKVILQFGKIGKDIFTMDYRYPLSAFQAFAICLSSFDTKPACE